MSATVEQLLRDPRIWRGRARPTLQGQRTGFAALDRALPGRGWPAGSVIELLPRRPGIGELALLLPALRGVAQSWVAPPWIPYAPALAGAGIALERLLVVQPERPRDALWALEQILRAGTSSHVLGWDDGADTRSLRRLQLAAEHGGARLFLFRPARLAGQASPAALRLYLEPAEDGLYLRILKCRGGEPAAMILEFEHDTPVAVHRAAAAAPGGAAGRAA